MFIKSKKMIVLEFVNIFSLVNIFWNYKLLFKSQNFFKKQKTKYQKNKGAPHLGHLKFERGRARGAQCTFPQSSSALNRSSLYAAGLRTLSRASVPRASLMLAAWDRVACVGPIFWVVHGDWIVVDPHGASGRRSTWRLCTTSIGLINGLLHDMRTWRVLAEGLG